MEALMESPIFKTVLTGAGFFADSYDLFAIEGVNNILKALGPAVHVPYNGTTFAFTQYCGDTTGTSCLPFLRDPLSGAWVPNPNTVYTPEFEPRYQAQTTDNKAGVANAALIGSILGQLCFGLAGDLLGRKWTFVLSSTLLILGCLGSATAMAGFALPCTAYVGGMCASFNQQPGGTWDNVYVQLAIWRGILGFGVGGEYPLASTITSEGSSTKTRGRSVATVFSMQGWGKLAAAIMNYAVVATSSHYGGSLSIDGSWRVTLALGCLPNLLTLYFRWRLHESAIYSKQKKAETGVDGDTLVVTTVDKQHHKHKKLAHLSAWTTLSVIWEYRWTLFGTASSWFLIDVTFYGQGLMNTSVVQSAVASTTGLAHPMDKLLQSLAGSIYVVLIALPGYWLAIATMDAVGRKRLQYSGFFMETVVFVILAAAYFTPLRTSARGAGYVIAYGLTYLFANWGPNSTTFIIPSEAFPTRARATAHGISAAMGKLGATAGSFGLLNMWYSYCTSSRDSTGAPNCSISSVVQAESDRGIIDVMWVCAGVSAAGLVCTLLFTKETGGITLEDVDASSQVLAAHDRDVDARHTAETAAALEGGSAGSTPEKAKKAAAVVLAAASPDGGDGVSPTKRELLAVRRESAGSNGSAAPLVVDSSSAAADPVSHAPSAAGSVQASPQNGGATTAPDVA